jgi:hypothetical protein
MTRVNTLPRTISITSWPRNNDDDDRELQEANTTTANHEQSTTTVPKLLLQDSVSVMSEADDLDQVRAYENELERSEEFED